MGIITGGPGAMFRAVEGAEDHPEFAQRDLDEIKLSDRDALVGIATSGRTPYVIAGLEYAGTLGAYRVGVSCNRDSDLEQYADVCITPVVGPEVISGSTRLKAGTATKMVLNMLTTASMVLLGKTYGNLMVDLRATNTKLVVRSRRIVSTLTDLSESEAERLLERCDGELKTAIVTHLRSVSPEEARRLLAPFKLVTSPLYLDFLCGGRELPCAAWANPTYNVRGWKGPCYLITDRHYEQFADLLNQTDWDRLGPGGDSRCEHCLVHCGFEPAAVLSSEKTLRDVLKMALWQMT